MIPKESKSFHLAPGFVLMSGLSIILFFISRYSFLLFHSLVELFTIFVAVLMFVVTWYTYAFSRNHFLMYLGCGYLWIALLDLLHTFIYKGMTMFPGVVGANPATQFWLAGRYLEALLLITAPLFLTRSLNRRYALCLFSPVSLLLAFVILQGFFPVAYQEGIGLTPFKVCSEYIIVTLMTSAIYLLFHRRALIPARIYSILLAGIALTICSDLTFTFYVGVNDLTNFIGHIFKLYSFWLIYEAIIHTTLNEPFTVLALNTTTYNAIPQATVLLDQEGKLRQANKAACQEAGLEETELVGKDFHALFHPVYLDKDSCPVCQALQAGQILNPTDLMLGDERGWRKFTLSPLGSEGKGKGVVQVSTNINQRKKAEEDLQATLLSLDQTVAERTRELQAKVAELEQTRDQLVASEKMASLGRLVAGFAHEINTPIGIAVGAASQLEDAANEIKRMLESEEIDEKDLKELLEIIAEGAGLTLANLRRAAELVQRFKRSSIDRASEKLRYFRVRELIDDVLVSLHNNLKKTQIAVNVDCPEELRIISVPGLIEQVLVNLIQNSLIHGFANGTQKGKIQISCSTRDNFHLEYHDNGRGMSADTLEHLFEPFYTTTRGTGSGLGMYISYNLIHHHHGTFYCESEPGQGVWFALDLPLSTMEDLEQAAMSN